MLRLAIAGLIVAMFVAADANGQCGCVDQSSKTISTSSVAGWMCYVKEDIMQNGFSWYEVKNCDSGNTHFVVGPSGLALGDCSKPSSSGCYQNPTPDAFAILHPYMSAKQKTKAKQYVMQKFSELVEALCFSLRETVDLAVTST